MEVACWRRKKRVGEGEEKAGGVLKARGLWVNQEELSAAISGHLWLDKVLEPKSPAPAPAGAGRQCPPRLNLVQGRYDCLRYSTYEAIKVADQPWQTK